MQLAIVATNIDHGLVECRISFIGQIIGPVGYNGWF